MRRALAITEAGCPTVRTALQNARAPPYLRPPLRPPPYSPSLLYHLHHPTYPLITPRSFSADSFLDSGFWILDFWVSRYGYGCWILDWMAGSFFSYCLFSFLFPPVLGRQSGTPTMRRGPIGCGPVACGAFRAPLLSAAPAPAPTPSCTGGGY